MEKNDNGKYWRRKELDRLDKRLNDAFKHIEVTNKELGDVETSMGKIATDVNWLKRFFWIVATSSVGALIAGVAGLVFV